MIELWSCLNKSNEMKTSKKQAKHNHRASTMFRIDKKPNLRYLRLLRTNTDDAEKRKKKQYLSHHKATSESFIKLEEQKTSKCSDNQRKRKCDDNLDLNSAESSAPCSKKQNNLDKTNNQRNSTHKLREIVVDGCNVAMAYESIFLFNCAYY